MINISFLEELEKFDLVIKRKVNTKYIGDRRSRFVGQGTIMSDHRMYTPGDDFRKIDWNVYARTDDLYIKRYDEERSLVVHAVIDGSKSMGFGEKVSKFDYSSLLGIGFCYLALKNNEKFRLSTFGDDLYLFPSNAGHKHLGEIVDYLNDFKLKGSSNFLKSMQRYKKTVSTRSFIVILSDFMFPIDELKAGLSLFKHHDLHIIQVLDPAEAHLNLEGDYYLKDSETGKEMRTSITPRLKTVYQKKLDNHIANIRNVCRQMKAKFWSITSDKPVFDVFWDVLR